MQKRWHLHYLHICPNRTLPSSFRNSPFCSKFSEQSKHLEKPKQIRHPFAFHDVLLKQQHVLQEGKQRAGSRSQPSASPLGLKRPPTTATAPPAWSPPKPPPGPALRARTLQESRLRVPATAPLPSRCHELM